MRIENPVMTNNDTSKNINTQGPTAAVLASIGVSYRVVNFKYGRFFPKHHVNINRN